MAIVTEVVDVKINTVVAASKPVFWIGWNSQVTTPQPSTYLLDLELDWRIRLERKKKKQY